MRYLALARWNQREMKERKRRVKFNIKNKVRFFFGAIYGQYAENQKTLDNI